MAATVDWLAENAYYREAIEEAAAEPEPRDRAAALRHVIDELDGLRDAAYERLQEAADAESELAWGMAFRLVRENADMREELLRRGMATPERLDALGYVSHEQLDEAAEAGELYESAFAALGRLGGESHGGGGGLLKWLEKLHPRDRGGKFARKPGSGKLTAMVGRDAGGPGKVKGEAKAPSERKPEKVFATQDVTPAELAVQSKEGLAPGQRPAGMSRRQAQQERPRTREGARRTRGVGQTPEELKAAEQKDREKRQKALDKRVAKQTAKAGKAGRSAKEQEAEAEKAKAEGKPPELTGGTE
jgi:hypothetical protein